MSEEGFTTIYGLRRTFRLGDHDVSQAVQYFDNGLLERVKQVLELGEGWRVIPVFNRSPYANTLVCDYCTCHDARKKGEKHKAFHLALPRSQATNQPFMVQSWMKAAGGAIAFRFVKDGDDKLYTLDEVLGNQDAEYRPSAYFAPLFATEKRLAAEAAKQRQEAMKKK